MDTVRQAFSRHTKKRDRAELLRGHIRFPCAARIIEACLSPHDAGLSSAAQRGNITKALKAYTKDFLHVHGSEILPLGPLDESAVGAASFRWDIMSSVLLSFCKITISGDGLEEIIKNVFAVPSNSRSSCTSLVQAAAMCDSIVPFASTKVRLQWRGFSGTPRYRWSCFCDTNNLRPPHFGSQGQTFVENC